MNPAEIKIPSSLDELNQQIVSCRLCPRLVAWREETAVKKRRAFRDWDYWGKPIPCFGDPEARIYLIGLAPAAHGGNRTGRVFTGDRSGDFLFESLYRAGFANQPTSVHREDGLEVKDIYIGATCRCVPPDNKPSPAEIAACEPFLIAELALLKNLQGIICLGGIAFDKIVRTFRARGLAHKPMKFGHAMAYDLGSGLPWIVTSYHPSQQNTQTGRLTPDMLDQIWAIAKARLRD